MSDPGFTAPREIHRAKSPVYALCGSGDEFLAGCGDGQVLSWSWLQPERIRLTAVVPASVFALALLPSGSLAAGTSDGEFYVLDLNRREATARIRAHAKAIHAIQPLRDARLCTAGADGALRIWQLKEGRWAMQRDLPLSDGKLRGLDASPDDRWLAVACGDGPVRVLDTERFNERFTFTGHEGGALTVRFHPTKPVLLSGGKDGHLRAWSLIGERSHLPAVAAHRSSIYAIVASPGHDLLATASRDKRVKLWDAATLDHRITLDHARHGHAHSVNALAWLDRGLVSGGDDRRLLLWDTLP